MMKTRTLLLLSSFFISAVTATTMFQNKNLNETYGAANGTLQRKIRDEQSNNNSKHQELFLRSTTIADPMHGMREEELSENSSSEFLIKKTQEARDVAKKWEDHLTQKNNINDDIHFANEGVKEETLKSVMTDLEQWGRIKEKADKLGQSYQQQLSIRKLNFSTLSLEASRAIEQAKSVASFYLDALPQNKTFQNEMGTANQNSLNDPVAVINPLFAACSITRSTSHSSNQQQSSLKQRPTPSAPLEASTLAEVLETWCQNAEIRYDEKSKQYKSNGVHTKSPFDAIGRMVTRTSQERKENYAALEKIIQEQGTDHAEQWNNHGIIFFKGIVKEPLTPELVIKIKKNIQQRNATPRRIMLNFETTRSAISSFFNNISTAWTAAWVSFRMQREYDQI